MLRFSNVHCFIFLAVKNYEPNIAIEKVFGRYYRVDILDKLQCNEKGSNIYTTVFNIIVYFTLHTQITF